MAFKPGDIIPIQIHPKRWSRQSGRSDVSVDIRHLPKNSTTYSVVDLDTTNDDSTSVSMTENATEQSYDFNWTIPESLGEGFVEIKVSAPTVAASGGNAKRVSINHVYTVRIETLNINDINTKLNEIETEIDVVLEEIDDISGGTVMTVGE